MQCKGCEITCLRSELTWIDQNPYCASCAQSGPTRRSAFAQACLWIAVICALLRFALRLAS
jgi:hypothetical protein